MCFVNTTPASASPLPLPLPSLFLADRVQTPSAVFSLGSAGNFHLHRHLRVRVARRATLNGPHVTIHVMSDRDSTYTDRHGRDISQIVRVVWGEWGNGMEIGLATASVRECGEDPNRGWPKGPEVPQME